MPDFAIPYLTSYVVTEDDKQRRQDLLDRLRPGQVSSNLADAVFWVDEIPGEDANSAEMEDGEVVEDTVSDEVLEMRVKRNRQAWPWLLGMSRWGYPSGWLAGQGAFNMPYCRKNRESHRYFSDPIEEVRSRIKLLPMSVGFDEDDKDDILEIYGGLSDMNTSSSGSRASSPNHKVAKLPDTNGRVHLLRGTSVDPGQPNGHPALPPPPLEEPIPLPPPPPPPSDAPPTPPPRHTIKSQRWARFPTDMFDSDRLMAYTSARPLPLGM